MAYRILDGRPTTADITSLRCHIAYRLTRNVFENEDEAFKAVSVAFFTERQQPRVSILYRGVTYSYWLEDFDMNWFIHMIWAIPNG